MNKATRLLFTLIFIYSFSFAQPGTTSKPEKPVNSLQKKRILKIDFLAPATGNSTIGYEVATKSTTSFDFQVGVIGAGFDAQNENPAGLFIKGGPVIYFKNIDENEKAKEFNNFKGTYIKPTFLLNYYTFQYTYYDGWNNLHKSDWYNLTAGGFLLNLGHQFVYNKTVAFNFYGGIGYNISSYTNKSNTSYIQNTNYGYQTSYQYAVQRIGDFSPLAVDGGIEIGILLK